MPIYRLAHSWAVRSWIILLQYVLRQLSMPLIAASGVADLLSQAVVLTGI
jgi:hypothetical protein